MYHTTERNWNNKRIRNYPLRLPKFVFLRQYVNYTHSKYRGHVHTQTQEKEEKIAVIPPPDAVIYPWTMMIESLQHKNDRNYDR